MPAFHAPLDDMRFVLQEIAALDELRRLPGYEEVSDDLSAAVLEEAGRFSEEVLLPLNGTGDVEGCRLDNGVVRTPEGFKEAYRAFTEAGWSGVYCDPEYGGQGLPGTLSLMVDEILCSTNLSFSMYVALTHGVYNAVLAHGDETLKRTYLPALVSGRWTGTMCLTEPQCGTDLALIKTRAEPDGETYKLTGTKIFISAGEHDLSENIVHLVLARTPGAPEGIRGISLFLVPKFLPGPDGAPGERNGVVCGGLEHKMGIRASSTCVLDFEDARGFLVGALHKGMRAMFTMMNAARLEVGIQGLGLAEAAYQGAASYARERLQGRALGGPRYPEQAADPIVVHPDVRRMLLTMRAYVEGSRALGAWVAKSADISARHPDTRARRDADELVQLMTPIVKALFTDIGSECANLGVQVFGGHGYIRDNGMEQLVRDARITQIYEGTNGVQALDLVGRKLSAHMGRYLRGFFHPLDRYLQTHADDPELAEFVEPLAKAFGRLQRVTGWVAEQGVKRPETAAVAATEYLRLFGLVALGYMWTRMAAAAGRRLQEGPQAQARFHRAKLDTGRFFVQRLLPQTGALFASIMSGAENVMAFEEEAF